MVDILLFFKVKIDQCHTITPDELVKEIVDFDEFIKLLRSLSTTMILPFATKMAARTIGIDLVSAKPLSAPIFLDDNIKYTYIKQSKGRKTRI